MACSPILRLRSTPHISNGLDRIIYHSIQLDMETGVGLQSLAYSRYPQAVLQYSSDGGHSWSKEEWGSIGDAGRHSTRLIWRRLGMARDRVFRFIITAPVKVVLLGAEMKVSVSG